MPTPALLAGYRRFRAEVWPERRALFERLARERQQPPALVIACSDSRVDPAMIFGTAPGTLFIVRNVAALVPPFAPDDAYHGTSAAIEYAITVLEVPDVVVLGHGMCGGIAALLAPQGAQGAFIAPWIALARPAAERVLACTPAEAAQDACEHEVIKLSLANLRTFPFIAAREAAGRLRLHGARFAINTGILELLQPDGGFAPA
jgi:carbonic anhydrase